MKDLRKTDSEWVILTTSPLAVPIGAAMMAFGAAASVYFHRHPEFGAVNAALIVSAVMVGGLFLLTYRRTLTLDKDARRVRVVARYFGIPFSESLQASGACFVERWSQRSEELGNAEMFDVVLNGHLLVRLSDDQGRADSLAREIAAFLSVAHEPPRYSKRERARLRRQEKYARVPLFVIAAITFAAGIYYLLTA